MHVIGEKAGETDLRINFTFTGVGEQWTMWVRNGVLNARSGHVDGAQCTVTGSKAALAGLLRQPGKAVAIAQQTGVEIEGDIGAFETLASVTDTFDPHFNIVTP